MTMVFVGLVLIEFFKAYNYRSDRRSFLRRPFANKWLNLAIAWETMLLLRVVYLPFFQRAIGTFHLPLNDWLIVTGMALTIFPVLELAKMLVRRGLSGATT
jgi:Ca2+-transporting ATPase